MLIEEVKEEMEAIMAEEIVEVRIRRKKYKVTRKLIESTLKNLSPGRISKYSLSYDNQLFPIKQALAEALNISPLKFGSSLAFQVLEDLGFEIIEKS